LASRDIRAASAEVSLAQCAALLSTNVKNVRQEIGQSEVSESAGHAHLTCDFV